jgi:tetratricopeptide (TPR) repeat protein
LFPERELPTAGRPLVNLSFAVNFAVGGTDVRGYHIVNLACHLLAGLLVFAIVRRTLQLPQLNERFGMRALNLGFASGILWTLHPLNTEAVDYLTQRTELMMGLFYLLTLYASIRSLAGKSRSWQVVAALSCAAGMMCKESMATAPVVVALYEAIFVFGSFKRAFIERGWFYATLGASWIVLGTLMWSGPRVHSAGFSSGISPWIYLLNQTVMITRYLYLTIRPVWLVVNYGTPLPVTLRDVLPYATFIMVLLTVTVVTLVRQPKWGFLGAWFFITLAPTSTIVPIATEVGAERRMYLPLIAIVVLVVVGVSMIRMSTRSRALIAAAAALLLATGTVLRNREYASPLALARTVIERYPTSSAHESYGVELTNAGDHAAAMIELRRAIPGAPRAHYQLAIELLRDGRLSEAIEHFQTFLRERPLLLEAVTARQLLGEAFAKQERWPEAIEQYQMVLRMNPSKVQYVNALAHLGVAFIATERVDRAIQAFRRVVEVEPTNADAQRNLANALYDHEEYAAAAVHAERAVALRPTDAEAHRLLGRLLALLGRVDDARTHLEEALRLSPQNPDAKEDLQKLQLLIR